MKSWYGFRGTCYRYETEEPEDRWQNLPWKVALHIWILRRLGVKEGMCVWPNKWFERPLRILFHPWGSVKNKLYWLFKAPM